jgi:hypothetical protein
MILLPDTAFAEKITKTAANLEHLSNNLANLHGDLNLLPDSAQEIISTPGAKKSLWEMTIDNKENV